MKKDDSIDRELKKAQRELAKEAEGGVTRTSFLIEIPLLQAAQELALKRKHAGKEPTTVTGIIKEALKEFLKKENISI